MLSYSDPRILQFPVRSEYKRNREQENEQEAPTEREFFNFLSRLNTPKDQKDNSRKEKKERREKKEKIRRNKEKKRTGEAPKNGKESNKRRITTPREKNRERKTTKS